MFGNVDHYEDVILPGAFTKTLQMLAASGRKLKMFWQHDTYCPIGVGAEVEQDQNGLKVKGEINLQVQKGAECYALMKQGAIDSLSFGYQSVIDEIKNGIRYLKEVKLFEFSPVSFECNNMALITSVKSVKSIDQIIQDLEVLKKSLQPAVAIEEEVVEPVVDHSKDAEIVEEMKKINRERLNG